MSPPVCDRLVAVCRVRVDERLLSEAEGRDEDPRGVFLVPAGNAQGWGFEPFLRRRGLDIRPLHSFHVFWQDNVSMPRQKQFGSSTMLPACGVVRCQEGVVDFRHGGKENVLSLV